MYMSFFVYVPIEVLLCCTLVGACGPKAMNKILLSCYPVYPLRALDSSHKVWNVHKYAILHLTQCCLVTPCDIIVLIIILGNGSSSHYLNQFELLSVALSRTNFYEIFLANLHKSVQGNAFVNVVCEIVVFCTGLGVLYDWLIEHLYFVISDKYGVKDIISCKKSW